MPKLGKQYYLNAKGESKLNCFKINIPKNVVLNSGLTSEDELKIYALERKIVIEKEEK